MPEKIDYKYFGLVVVLSILTYFILVGSKSETNQKIPGDKMEKNAVSVYTHDGITKMDPNVLNANLEKIKTLLNDIKPRAKNTKQILYYINETQRYLRDFIDNNSSFSNININNFFIEKRSEKNAADQSTDKSVTDTCEDDVRAKIDDIVCHLELIEKLNNCGSCKNKTLNLLILNKLINMLNNTANEVGFVAGGDVRSEESNDEINRKNMLFDEGLIYKNTDSRQDSAPFVGETNTRRIDISQSIHDNFVADEFVRENNYHMTPNSKLNTKHLLLNPISHDNHDSSGYMNIKPGKQRKSAYVNLAYDLTKEHVAKSRALVDKGHRGSLMEKSR